MRLLTTVFVILSIGELFAQLVDPAQIAYNLTVTSIQPRFWRRTDIRDPSLNGLPPVPRRECGGWEYITYHVPNDTRSAFITVSDGCSNMTAFATNPDSYKLTDISATEALFTDSLGFQSYASQPQSDLVSSNLTDFYYYQDTYGGQVGLRSFTLWFPSDIRAKSVVLICANMSSKVYSFGYQVTPFRSGVATATNFSFFSNQESMLRPALMDFELAANSTLRLSMALGRELDGSLRLESQTGNGLRVAVRNTTIDSPLYNKTYWGTCWFWPNEAMNCTCSIYDADYTNWSSKPIRVRVVLTGWGYAQKFRSDSDSLSVVIWALILFGFFGGLHVLLLCVWVGGRCCGRKREKVVYVEGDSQTMAVPEVTD